MQPALTSKDGTAASIGVLLADSPFSNDALDLVSGPLRDAAHGTAGDGVQALVGGQTSAFADVREATDRDLRLIFPVAGVLIAVVLALLLRSVVARSTCWWRWCSASPPPSARPCTSSRASAATPA